MLDRQFINSESYISWRTNGMYHLAWTTSVPIAQEESIFYFFVSPSSLAVKPFRSFFSPFFSPSFSNSNHDANSCSVTSRCLRNKYHCPQSSFCTIVTLTLTLHWKCIEIGGTWRKIFTEQLPTMELVLFVWKQVSRSIKLQLVWNLYYNFYLDVIIKVAWENGSKPLFEFESVEFHWFSVILFSRFHSVKIHWESVKSHWNFQ